MLGSAETCTFWSIGARLTVSLWLMFKTVASLFSLRAQWRRDLAVEQPSICNVRKRSICTDSPPLLRLQVDEDEIRQLAPVALIVRGEPAVVGNGQVKL